MSAQLEQCRMLCANRLRRLERYKKAKSFCSLDEENAGENLLMAYAGQVQDIGLNSASMSSLIPSASTADFEHIREQMMSLVDEDMQLLQQLLSLSDKIDEIKSGMRRCRSERKLSAAASSSDEEDRPLDPLPSEGSAVTNLYVDSEAPQYFSRKNSVLRIPIPPRSSNRFNRRPPRRTSEALKISVGKLREETDELVQSENSDEPISPALTYSHSSASSCTSGSIIAKKTRSSHSSIDSGLPPTPTESD